MLRLTGHEKCCRTPPGRFDFGSQISGPKSSPQSGTACHAPHRDVQDMRCQNTGCILGPKGGPRNQASWWPRRLGQTACSGNDSNALPGERTSHRAHCFTRSSPALVCLVLCPSHMVRSLRSRARFSSPNAATEATTPPFCIFSLRLRGFCTPRRQQRAETLDFPMVDEVFAKTQKVLFDMFRSTFEQF